MGLGCCSLPVGSAGDSSCSSSSAVGKEPGHNPGLHTLDCCSQNYSLVKLGPSEPWKLVSAAAIGWRTATSRERCCAPVADAEG